MIELLWQRLINGSLAIPNIRKARAAGSARIALGLSPGVCAEDCAVCGEVCPVEALASGPTVDRGRCVLCGECVRACPSHRLSFDPDCRIATDSRAGLNRSAGEALSPAIRTRRDLRSLLGQSLKLRSVSAGGCNACEMELNAAGNANFDMGRFGIEFTASPRHADGLVITGPITKQMAPALEDTFAAVPGPKLIILVGSCAISGGLFRDSPELDRSFLDRNKVDLFIPGCPPHPLTFINGLLDLLGRK